jgi:5-methylcytosine-specific restriction endonuclease McrA
MPYKDPERRREYGRQWIRRNPEKAREAMRRWRARHPEEHNAQTREHYARHRAERSAQSAAYHKANPHVRQAAWERRRARKVGAEGSFSSRDWTELLEFYGHCCAYCGSSEIPTHQDHAAPLCRGGDGYIENIRPACPTCNLRKHKLTEDEYRARRAKEGLYVRPRLRRVAGFEEASGSFSASAIKREG